MACEMRDKAITLFTETFGEKPSVYSYAPGRVNFIGEHTDYCEGFVCPLAIHYGTAIVGRKVPGKVCDMWFLSRLDMPCCFFEYGGNDPIPWRLHSRP